MSTQDVIALELQIHPHLVYNFKSAKAYLLNQIFSAIVSEFPGRVPGGLRQNDLERQMKEHSFLSKYAQQYEQGVADLAAEWVRRSKKYVEDNHTGKLRPMTPEEKAKKASLSIAADDAPAAIHSAAWSLPNANGGESTSAARIPLPKANDQEPSAGYVPLWQSLTGLTTLDPGKIWPNVRQAALIKICNHAKVELARHADRFVIPEGGFTAKRDKSEPSHKVAAELGLSEPRLNSYMNEITGLTARQTWDEMRAEKALQFIYKTEYELLNEYSLCHLLNADTAISALLGAKRRKGVNLEHLAERCGFKNPTRLKRACLDRHATSLSRLEVIQLERGAADAHELATNGQNKIRPLVLHYGHEYSLAMLTMTRPRLQMALGNPEKLLLTLEQISLKSPKNEATAHVFLKNRRCNRSQQDLDWADQKDNPQVQFVRMDEMIERWHKLYEKRGAKGLF